MGLELSRYDLVFEPWRTIKAQALADFLAENAMPVSKGELHPCPWNLYVDDSSTKDRSGADLIIKSPTGVRNEDALKFMFKASNSEAECEALIARIELCYTTGVDSVQAFSNSQLVVSQPNGAYEAKDNTVTTYVRWVREAIKLLKDFAITYISRSENR